MTTLSSIKWNQNYIAIIPAITDELDENYNINGGFTERQVHTFYYYQPSLLWLPPHLKYMRSRLSTTK